MGARVLSTKAVSAVALARAFSEALHGYLGAGIMRTVVEKNAGAKRDNCCASHDFCDANMVMLGEYARLSGEHEDDVDLDAVIPQFNDAWDIAKAAEFDVTRIASSVIAARLAGRCANGAERDGGRRYHALARFSEFGTALCGAKPGRTSGGWCQPYGDQPVTCPRCLSKIRVQP